MANKKITYGIGFNVDKSGLEELKRDLKMIQSFTEHDLKIFDPSLANKSTTEIQKRLTEVHQTAADIGTALQKSFNTKLDTISLQDFERHLQNTATGTIPQAAERLKNLGDVGKKAFFDLSTQLLTTKRELKETHSWLDKMSETLTNTVRWKIASGAIDAITGSISNAWNYAKRLDTSLNDIRIVTGKSADEMDRFARKANQAAKSLGAATTNYSNAALIYYQQGLNEEDVAARAGVTVKAANVTGQTASEVSEQLTAVWNGYKVVAEEAELYVDKLAAVAAETAADLEELSTGMSKVASAASTMGVDVDQLSAQLSTIISVTRQDAAVVGTALKTIYARMGDLKVDGVDEFGTSLGEVSGQLQQMGINVLDQQGNLREMGDVIEEVAAKWGTWTDAQQQAAAVAIAGKRQYNNLIALFENWDMYESSLTTSQTSAGTLQKQQDIYMDSLEAHLNKLTAASERLYDALINNESMNTFIDGFTVLVDLAGTFVESIGGAGNILMALGPLFSKTIGKSFGSFLSTEITNFQNKTFNKRENAAQESAVKFLRDANIGLYETEKTISEKKKSESKPPITKSDDDNDDIPPFSSNNIDEDKEALKKLLEERERVRKEDEEKLKELQEKIRKQKEQVQKEADDKLKDLQPKKEYLESISQDLGESNKIIYSGRYMTGGKLGKALTPQGEQARISQSVSKSKLEDYLDSSIQSNDGREIRKIAKGEIQKLDDQMAQILNEIESKQKEYDEELKRLLEEQKIKQQGYDEEVRRASDEYEKKRKAIEKRNSKPSIIDRQPGQKNTNINDDIIATESKRDQIYSKDAQTIIDLKQRQLDLAHAMTTEEINASDERIAAIAQEIKLIREKEQILEEISQQYQEDLKLNRESAQVELERLKNRKSNLEKIKENLESSSSDTTGETFKNNKRILNSYGIRTGQLKDKDIIPAAQQEISKMDEEIAALEKGIEQYDKKLNESLDSQISGYEKLLELKKEDLSYVREQKKESEKVLINLQKANKENENADEKIKEISSFNFKDDKEKRYKTDKANDRKKKAERDVSQAWKDSDKYISSLNEKLKENTNLSQDNKIAIASLVEKYNTGNITLKEKEDILKKIVAALNTAEQETKEDTQNIEQNTEALRRQNEELERKKKENDEIDAKKKIESITQSIANVTGTMMSLIAVWNTLQNLGSIWNDEDLTTGEKIVQTITGVISVLMTLMPVISAIGPTILASSKIGAKGFTALGTSGSAAGWSLQAAFWPVLLIGLAIISTLLIAVGLFALFGQKSETNLEKAQKAFDKAQKSAEEAKQTLSNLREEYSSLMEEISKYRDAETAIDAMRVGTEEWQEATEKLNQQVEELIEKYPDLKAELEVDEDGNYRLNEDTISKVAAAQRNRINEQKTISAGASLAAEKARGVLLQEEQKEDYLNSESTKNNTNILGALYHIETGKAAFSDTVEDRQSTILNSNFEDLITKIDESNEYSDKSKEFLKEAVSKLQDSQKSLEKNKEATDQLRDAYLASLVEDDGLSGEVYNNLIDTLGIDTEDPIHETVEDYIKEGTKDLYFKDENGNLTEKVQWVGDKIENVDIAGVKDFISRFSEEGSIIDYGQLEGTALGDLGSHKIVVDGQEMSVNQLIAAYNTRKANQINAERTVAITDEMKRLNSAGLMQEAAYFNNSFMGNENVDWDGATLAKLDTISKYEGADYKTKTDVAAETLKKSIRDILGLGDSTNVDVYSNLTETQVQHLKNSMDAANMAGAGDSIAKTVAGITDPEKMAEFQALLEGVNWTSAESVNQFRSGLIEAGIEIDNTGNVWGDFIQSVNSGMKQWVDNSKKVGENLAFIRDTVEEIELGSLISDEEYKKMVQINPEVAKYFVKTAGGMVAIANGREIAGALKQQYSDLGQIATHFENVTKAVGTSQGNAYLKREDISTTETITDYFTNRSKNQFANIAKALELSGADNLLDENGIIAKAQAGDSGSIELLADMIMAVNQAQLDVANGEYNTAAAQQIYGTSVASSWSEAEQGVEVWTDEATKQKVQDYWKTSYLSELGLDLSSELIRAFDITELENAAIAARKLELDYFAKINAELDKLGILIDQSFGLEKQKLLQEQIELQKENYQAAVTREQIAGDLFKTLVNNTGFEEYLDEETGEFDYSKFLTDYGSISETDENYTAVQEILSVYSKVNETAQAAAEASQAVIDAQIESFKYTLDIQKQYKETVKEWKKFSQEFDKFTENAGMSVFGETSVKDIISNLIDYNNTAYNDYTTNNAETALSQMQSWMDGGGTDNPYVNATTGEFNEAFWQADYDQYLADYQSYIEDMRNSGQELYDSWFSALDEISAMYDKEIEKLSAINSLLESSASLNQLFGKESAKYFTQIRQNAEQTVDLYKNQAIQLEQQYNNFFDEEGNLIDPNTKEQADAVWNAYLAAKQNHADAIQAQYEAIAAEFETKLKETVDTLFGGSLSNVSELWNLQKSEDSMYFDDVNAEYEMYKFEREIQKSIDATDNIAAQNKLKDVLNEQLSILEEKDKLSQYDIDRANAMYDLTLKQIALEEAQQTANKMKLTRDAMGNYTYQYVADEDKIAQAEEELAAAENNFYNLQKDHQSELIDTMISGVQEYQELTVKYMNDPEMLQKIQDHYSTFFGNLRDDMSVLGMDVTELTELFGSDMSTPWMETFNNLAEIDTAELLNSTAQLFEGENGITAVLASVNNNFNDYLEAENGLNERLGKYVTNVSDLNTDAVDLAGKMTEASNAIGTLVSNISTLVGNLEGYADKYTTWLEEAIGIERDKSDTNKATDDNTDAIIENTKVTQEFTNAMGDFVTTINKSLPLLTTPITNLPNPGYTNPVQPIFPIDSVTLDQSRNSGVSTKIQTTGIRFDF